MARQRLTFIITWGLLWIASQLPLIILFSAIGFDSKVVAISETIAAIVTATITSMLMIKEEI
jgi:hypothetical protein